MIEGAYSGTQLYKKLGIKPGMKVLLLNTPENYFDLLGMDIGGQISSSKNIPDLIHFFAKNNTGFIAGMKKILVHCKKNTGIAIWVSWNKKSSEMHTDLTEDIIRNFALQNGLVDIKVCAVSKDWSGLKLVVPVSKR